MNPMYAVPRKRVIFSQAAGGLTPAQVRAAYNVPANLDGSGQTIALLEFGSGYSAADVQTFAKQFLGLDGVDVELVDILGGSNDGGTQPDDLEATLDIQWALAMAPRAKIVVYEAPAGANYTEFGANLLAALQFLLADSRNPGIVSISYGDAEVNFAENVIWQGVEAALAALAAKGVSVFVSSGDQGAYGEHWLGDDKVTRVDFPASCPHAIAVGGTNLGAGGQEAAWTFYGPQNGGATGGGESYLFDAPAWQPSAMTSKFGISKRGVPDVAAVADPASGCQAIFQGQDVVIGGTSLAAPVWAGIIACVNQALGKRAGFFLPQLYANPAACKDITEGNNSFNGVTGYNAELGWDPCTGLGSPDVGKLVDLLAGKPVAPTHAKVVKITANQPTYMVNGQAVQSPDGISPRLIDVGNGQYHLFVPIRTTAAILGADVDWDEATLTATVMVP